MLRRNYMKSNTYRTCDSDNIKQRISIVSIKFNCLIRNCLTVSVVRSDHITTYLPTTNLFYLCQYVHTLYFVAILVLTTCIYYMQKLDAKDTQNKEHTKTLNIYEAILILYSYIFQNQHRHEDVVDIDVVDRFIALWFLKNSVIFNTKIWKTLKTRDRDRAINI